MIAPPVEPRSFVHSTAVRFQDVDAAGILFFARALDLFHDAYVAFLEAHHLSLADALREGSWAAPIRHVSVGFQRPLSFGDTLGVELYGARLSTTDVHLGFRAKKATGEIAFAGEALHVFVDRATFRRMPVPEAARLIFSSLPALDPSPGTPEDDGEGPGGRSSPTR